MAPVTIEKNAFTAAGSTITNNVPEDTLAIGRSRQINKEGYAKKIRNKQEHGNATEKNGIDKNPVFLAARKSEPIKSNNI